MATLTDQILQSIKQTNVANKAREKEIRALFQDILGRYGEGGSFGAGYQSELERTKTRDVASGTQSLVSAGLSNTTQAAGIGKKWEEEVGAPARLRLEDLRMDRLSQAERDYGSFIERISDTGPDINMISQLLSQGTASAPTFGSSDFGSSSFSSQRPSTSNLTPATLMNNDDQYARSFAERERMAKDAASVQMGEPMIGDPYIRNSSGQIIGMRNTTN